VIRDAARALVLLLALLILLAEVQQADEATEYESAQAAPDNQNDF